MTYQVFINMLNFCINLGISDFRVTLRFVNLKVSKFVCWWVIRVFLVFNICLSLTCCQSFCLFLFSILLSSLTLFSFFFLSLFLIFLWLLLVSLNLFSWLFRLCLVLSLLLILFFRWFHIFLFLNQFCLKVTILLITIYGLQLTLTLINNIPPIILLFHQCPQFSLIYNLLYSY